MNTTIPEPDLALVTQRVYAVLVIEAEMERARARDALTRVKDTDDQPTVLMFEAAYAARQNALDAMIQLLRAAGGLVDIHTEDGAVVRAFELAPLEYKSVRSGADVAGCVVCGSTRANIIRKGMCRHCLDMTERLDDEDDQARSVGAGDDLEEGG